MTAAAQRLLASLLDSPQGQLSPSIYETGRLVTLAPWLAGHDGRVEFLLAQQRADGGWGGPESYGLVPSLSAVEALLTERHRRPPGGRSRLAGASRAGLAWARAMLDRARWLPDTPAIEVLVPVLVEAVNEHLRSDGADADAPLGLPPGVDAALASDLRGRIASGARLPEKVLHALEIAGPAARAANAAVVPPGTVGASPAATAAWLGEHSAGHRPDVLAYLEGAARPHGGPVPSVLPVTMFERAWVLDSLLDGGVPITTPPALADALVAALGPHGTPGGAGLPCDADTTSVTILVAHRLGRRVSLDPLRHYERSTHFVTWDGERTSSSTTNAHALKAIAGVDAEPEAAAWRRAAAVKVSRWLGEQQSDEGTWVDKWHASPYYATAASAGALRDHGGPATRRAVERAVRWTVDTQHEDGSWGVWGGTAEETAYALALLVPTLPRGPVLDPNQAATARAAARGLAYLRARAGQPRHVHLWHDKDLYTPTAVVEAAIMAALRLARSHPAVGAAGPRP